jgi:hypothetical protein
VGAVYPDATLEHDKFARTLTVSVVAGNALVFAVMTRYAGEETFTRNVTFWQPCIQLLLPKILAPELPTPRLGGELVSNSATGMSR